MSEIKGYEAGKPTSFTPGRSSKWLDEFNQLLHDHKHLSRNKLTEELIIEGMKAWTQVPGSRIQPINQVKTQSNPNSENEITLDTKGLTDEQIELLKTTKFQGILNKFVLTMFDKLENAQNEAINEVISAEEQVAAVTSSELIEVESQVIEPVYVPEEQTQSNIEEKEVKPIQHLVKLTNNNESDVDRVQPQPPPPQKKRADINSALKFVKNASLNN